MRPHLSVLIMSGFLEARPWGSYSCTGKATNFLVSNTLKSIKVKDIKGLPVAIKVDTSIRDAMIQLVMKDASSLFVVERGGYLVGVVSREDCLKYCLAGEDRLKTTVGDIMTPMPSIVLTVPEESAFEAAAKMMDHQLDSIPVVEMAKNGRYKVTGRITKTIITRLFVELGGK